MPRFQMTRWRERIGAKGRVLSTVGKNASTDLYESYPTSGGQKNTWCFQGPKGGRNLHILPSWQRGLGVGCKNLSGWLTGVTIPPETLTVNKPNCDAHAFPSCSCLIGFSFQHCLPYSLPLLTCGFADETGSLVFIVRVYPLHDGWAAIPAPSPP